MFIGLLPGTVNVPNHAKCIFLNNQECTTQPTLINLHPNEYSEGLNYYTSAVNFGRCVGIKNTLDDYQIEYVFQIEQKN